MQKPDGFDLVFKPRSIAVVGASNTPGTVGKAVMDNLLWGGYEGTIMPVNLKPVSFPNLKSYPSLAAIDASIDLAIIIVPAPVVVNVMQQAAKAGVKAAIIISAGFKEIGPAGAKLEAEVAKIAIDHGMVLIGPNCLGVINPHHKMNASFAGAQAEAGSIAFVSQSGALCTAVLDLANSRGLGFSKFVSIGNKATLHELDLLEYLSNDSETSVLMMYVEQLSANPSWVEAARRITHHPKNPKPIIVLKAGRSSAGASASLSHTGALAGNDAAYDAFFAQVGMTRAQTIAEMFDLASVFVQNTPPQKPGVGIITNAGGPSIIAADSVEMHHVVLAHFADHTEKSLEKSLPPTANIHNPVDLVGDATAVRYKEALELISKDASVGSLLIILTPQAMTDVVGSATAIASIRKAHPHLSVVVSFMGAEQVRSGVALLHRSHIATVPYPDAAAVALGELIQYGNFVHKPLPKVQSFHKARPHASDAIKEAEVLK